MSLTSLTGVAECIWLQNNEIYPDLNIEIVPTIDSTNSELIRRAKSANLDTTLLLALEQTAGRGRMGRRWVSESRAAVDVLGDAKEPSCLTFSLGLTWEHEHINGLSLAVGLAIAQSLHENILLKWPNDLLYQCGKLGGILIETVALGSKRYVICGVGININQPSSEKMTWRASCMTEIDTCLTIEDIFHRTACALLCEFTRFSIDGFASVCTQWNKKNAFAMKKIQTSDGFCGVDYGVNEKGALQLASDTGIFSVESNEIWPI
jgi:BirA family transcriptional regulator, biotin operon repressor / biotin---[acetyl-CoA-carboxylase] ligase